MYEYSCKVEKVVDGDTCDVILDLGFDILYKSRTRNKDEKARGKMASAFLKEAIEKGEKVVIQTKLKDSRGKFGRVLGDVVVDGANINQLMVKCHLAVAYYGQSKNDVEAEHMRNRDILIEKGLYTPID